MSDTREDLMYIDPWECEVCRHTGTPIIISDSKEEWGREITVECPSCSSTFGNGILEFRAEGEICDFCGEFVEEVMDHDGDEICLMCKECE